MPACSHGAVCPVREGSFCWVNIKLLPVSTSDSRAGVWEEYFVVSISLLYQNQYIIHSVHVIRGSTVTVGVSQYSGIPFVYILHTWIIDGVVYSCLCKSCVSPVFITFMHHWTWHKPCSSLIFFRFICISRSTVAI